MSWKKNIQLEIINQLTKSIGVNMSLHEIIENFIPKMQTLVYFDLLNLYIMRNGSKIRRVTFIRMTGRKIKLKKAFWMLNKLCRTRNTIRQRKT